MFLQLGHPFTRVAAVRVDLKMSLFLNIHLINHVLEGNHAVFEHPVPGVFFSMTAVVQVYVLMTYSIHPSILSSVFDLLENSLPLYYWIRISKEDTLETVGEMISILIIATGSLVKNFLHGVHIYEGTG